MSEPVMEVEIETFDGRKGRVRALFDTGAHRSIIREDCLPEGCMVVRRPTPERLRTAAQGGTLEVVGGTILLIGIGDRLIQADALVSPNLAQQMLIGAATMQAWDISVRNENGTTRVEVGHDVRDPDIQEVD